MQSRKGSFIESSVNILVGFGVALVSQLIIFPMFGVNLPLHENVQITCYFTVISFARSYFLRRLFNLRHKIETPS